MPTPDTAADKSPSPPAVRVGRAAVRDGHGPPQAGPPADRARPVKAVPAVTPEDRPSVRPALPPPRSIRSRSPDRPVLAAEVRGQARCRGTPTIRPVAGL